VLRQSIVETIASGAIRARKGTVTIRMTVEDDDALVDIDMPPPRRARRGTVPEISEPIEKLRRVGADARLQALSEGRTRLRIRVPLAGEGDVERVNPFEGFPEGEYPG
jgi:hypothetical protein